MKFQEKSKNKRRRKKDEENHKKTDGNVYGPGHGGNGPGRLQQLKKEGHRRIPSHPGSGQDPEGPGVSDKIPDRNGV